MAGPLETVKKALQAYVDKDRALIESVIGEPYSFTSPLDNAIDRKTYFDRCWPNSEHCKGMDFILGAETGERAWIVYESSNGDQRFRNCELHRIQNGKMVETQVYFGWDLPHKAAPGSFVNEA